MFPCNELSSPILFAIACGLWSQLSSLAIARRIAMPRGAALCVVVGVSLICLSIGGLNIRIPQTQQTLVMVDLSPSSRTAAYRDASRRDARIRQLLGSVDYRVENFADWPSVDHTDFLPPQASAIVLFSDGRFDLPATSRRRMSLSIRIWSILMMHRSRGWNLAGNRSTP